MNHDLDSDIAADALRYMRAKLTEAQAENARLRAVTVPHETVNLDAHRHPHDANTWTYGPARNEWQVRYPIYGHRHSDTDTATVEITGPLSVDRDRIPHLIGWLAAVYAASDPAVHPETAHDELVAAHRLPDPGSPDLLDADGDLWFHGVDDTEQVGYVCAHDGVVFAARTRADVDAAYGPLTEQVVSDAGGAS